MHDGNAKKSEDDFLVVVGFFCPWTTSNCFAPVLSLFIFLIVRPQPVERVSLIEEEKVQCSVIASLKMYLVPSEKDQLLMSGSSVTGPRFH